MLKQEEDSGCGVTQDKIFFLVVVSVIHATSSDANSLN